MSRVIPRKRLVAVISRAMGSPSPPRQLTLTSWEWDIAGNCNSPYLQEWWGRPAASGLTNVIDPTKSSLYLDLYTRCRACENCRHQRSSLWRHRAKLETALASRTWFGTLTLSPSQQVLALYRGQRAAKKRGVDLPDDVATRHKGASVLLTLFLKRLRKQSGTRFRYLIVCEAHKTGLPHYHALIHEIEGLKPVTEAALSAQWKANGFSQWRLVKDATQASYVTKYLSKDARARVRASGHYGRIEGPSRTPVA